MNPHLPWQLLALRYATMGSFAISLAAFAYGMASAPSRVASRLGLRGLKRQKALRTIDGWASFEPVIRWLGVRLGGLPSDGQRVALDRQISLAGDYLGLIAEEYLALFVVSTASGLLLGAIAGYMLDLGMLLVVAGGILGATMPYLVVSGEAQERTKNVSRGLPYVIDLMALSMGAGQDFPGAIRQVVDKSSNPDDPIVEEFMLLLQTLSLGRTRRDGLLEFARRVPAVSVSEFVNALVQAEERGNPVAEVLGIQAASARLRRSVRAEELAAKAGVKIVGPLMLVFLACITLILGPAILTIGENM